MRKAGCASTTCRFYGGATARITESSQCQPSHYGGSTDEQFSAVAHESFVTRVARLRHTCNITCLRFYLEGPFSNPVPIARVRRRHPVEREPQLGRVHHTTEDRDRDGCEVGLSAQRSVELRPRTGHVLLLEGERPHREHRQRHRCQRLVMALEECLGVG